MNALLIDLSPLKNYPQFRYLYLGQLVSALGSNISFVAAPYLLYQLTHSTAKVGLLGVISLVPLVLCGFWGGAIADSGNRRTIIFVCEGLLATLCLAFAYLVHADLISETLIYTLIALMSALTGFHRPALEALTPRLIPKDELPKVSSLQGFKGTFAHILGPAIGGLLIAHGGVTFAYLMDAASFFVSIICLTLVRNPRRDGAHKPSRPDLKAILDGFKYAMKRPVLLGTYLIDIAAMTFCYPVALFPAIAEMSGGATRLGPLYSAISVGALVATLFSRWTYSIKRHGAMVVLGAVLWCLAVLGFSYVFTWSYWGGFALLALAGYGDMISVMFRATIWNETIPDSHRGRLAGIEMISYMTGPLLGNTILGQLAAVTSISMALQGGALMAFIAVAVVAVWLSPFWRYRAQVE